MKTDIKRRKALKSLAGIGMLPFACNVMSAANITKGVKDFKNELVLNGEVITAAHWGVLRIKIKDGKIIKSGSALKEHHIYNDLQSNIKGQVENTRVMYPMVRKSYLKDPLNPKPELRGRDEWVRVSYPYALKLTQEALIRTIEKYGNKGIYGGSYGWQSTGRLHAASTLLKRFLGTIGGFTDHRGDYSTGASQVIMPHVLGTIEVYERQTSWPLILKHAKVVVIWGANPTTTLKASWEATDESGLTYYQKLKAKQDKGELEIIYIDPVYSETAEFLSIKPKNHIRIDRGTDVAMMLAMAYHLYTTKNYNKEFLDTYTTGFEKFLPYLLGKEDGIPKTPAWASKITNIDEETIKNLAMKFYKNPSMLISGWGMQRQDHGEQPHWMLVTLACMIGQIGKAGTGFGLNYHADNDGAPTCVAPVLGGISTQYNITPHSKWSRNKVGKDEASEGGRAWMSASSGTLVSIPLARVTECILNPGKTISFNGENITYPKIGLIYWAGGNPIVHQEQVNRNLQAFRAVDTVIINEIYFTPTARMADIIFPVTTSYERNDVSMSSSYVQKYMIPMKQCVAPVGESKSDYEIFCDLSKMFDTYDSYSDGGKKEMDWLREFYAQAQSQAKSLMLSIPSFDEFWAKNEPLEFTTNEENTNYIRHKEFIDDPLLAPLGTPSGLIEIYSDTIEKMKYANCGPHPKWYEPIEWLGMKNKPARFALVSAHPFSRLHSQQNNNIKIRNTYAINGREPMWINDQDAKELGIKQGDLVRVFNKRGQILAGAYVTDRIARNTVRICEGAWYDPMDHKDNTLDLNGCPNVLTIDMPTSNLGMGNNTTALVNVEKYTGKAPAVKVFDRIKAEEIA